MIAMIACFLLILSLQLPTTSFSFTTISLLDIICPKSAFLRRRCHVPNDVANRQRLVPGVIESVSTRYSSTTRRRRRMMMVRNIDLVETLIFYGAKSIMELPKEDDHESDDHDKTKLGTTPVSLLPGVESLIYECIRDDTAVVAIVESERCRQALVAKDASTFNDFVHIRPQTSAPPNPLDLWEAIHAIHIQPKGFGGSSGFGTKAADPERSPLPKHCVVLCHTENQCRAARYAGMRVLCLTDNALADAVVGDDGNSYWETIGTDDIATPGSFWLNPPHPRDDEGNAVDPFWIMESYESGALSSAKDGKNGSSEDKELELVAQEEKADNDYLAAILADMDPL